MSDSYRTSLVQRIEAGKAPQIEVLLHHYAFDQPKHTYVEPPRPESSREELYERLSHEELMQILDWERKILDILRLAEERPSREIAGGLQVVAPMHRPQTRDDHSGRARRAARSPALGRPRPFKETKPADLPVQQPTSGRTEEKHTDPRDFPRWLPFAAGGAATAPASEVKQEAAAVHHWLRK
jgi:hypothetical protein